MRDFPWTLAIFIWQETNKIEDHSAYVYVCQEAEKLASPDNMVTAVQQLKNLYDIYIMEELL